MYILILILLPKMTRMVDYDDLHGGQRSSEDQSGKLTLAFSGCNSQ